MAIRFACDACGRAYELPEAAVGRQAKCECGDMLIVPAESTPVSPPVATTPKPPPPPEPASATAKKERPPRTLHQAAEVARKKREAAEIDEAKLAEMASNAKQREAKSQEPAFAPTAPIAPPLPPPVTAPHPVAGSQGEPHLKKSGPKSKYRNLRRYCRYIQRNAIGVACLTALAVLGEIVYFVIQLSTVLNAGMADSGLLLVGFVIVGATLVAATALAGFFWYVLLNAIAEFFHVLMDIEENTRNTNP